MNDVVDTTLFDWYGSYVNGTVKSGRDVLFLYDGKWLTESSTYGGFAGIFSDKTSYGIPSYIPLTPTNPVRWSIFKYETPAFTATSTNLNALYFSFGSGTNLNISDIISSNGYLDDDLSENCKIYV